MWAIFKTYLAAVAYDRKKGWPYFFLGLILKFFSWLYLAGLTLVRLGYTKGWLRTYRPDCKIISVGNITLGGTGKTPLVAMIGSYLTGRRQKIAVLSRGYGPGTEPDEALLLKKNLPEVPVLSGSDRIANVIEARKRYGVDTIILDDGFQHWRLARSLDIVVVDVLNPFGNGHLLPRGILREPVSSLKRADIIFLICSGKSESVPDGLYYKIKAINPQALIIKSYRRPVCFSRLGQDGTFDLNLIRNQQIGMLCGIGHPENFKRTLLDMGLSIKADFIFPDHHLYTFGDITHVVQTCDKEGIKKIVTTQKDAVRLGWLGKRIKEGKYRREDTVKHSRSTAEAPQGTAEHREAVPFHRQCQYVSAAPPAVSLGSARRADREGLFTKITDIDFLVLHIEMKISDEHQQSEFYDRLSRLYDN